MCKDILGHTTRFRQTVTHVYNLLNFAYFRYYSVKLTLGLHAQYCPKWSYLNETWPTCKMACRNS